MGDLDTHLDMIAAAMAQQARHLDEVVSAFNDLRAENAALRDLLIKALPHTGRAAPMLTVAIRDALDGDR